MREDIKRYSPCLFPTDLARWKHRLPLRAFHAGALQAAAVLCFDRRKVVLVLASDQFHCLALLLWRYGDVSLGGAHLPMPRQLHDGLDTH